MRKIVEQVQMVKIFSPIVPDWCEHSTMLVKEEFTTQERADQLYNEAVKVYEANKTKMGGYPIMRIDWEIISERII